LNGGVQYKQKLTNFATIAYDKALTVPRCLAQRFPIVLKLKAMSSDSFGGEKILTVNFSVTAL